MRQEIEFPFAAGVREDIHRRVLPFGQLTTAENVHYAQDGKLVKRNGFQAVTMEEYDTTAFDPAAVQLTQYQGSDVVLGQTRLATYVAADDAFVLQSGSDWLNQCSHVTEKTIARKSGLKLRDPAVAHNAGYTLYAWVDDSTYKLYYLLIEEATGATIQSGSYSHTVTLAARAWQAGTKLFFGYLNYSGSGNYYLDIYSISTTAPATAPSLVLQKTDIAAGIACWDVSEMGYDAGTTKDWWVFVRHDATTNLIVDVRDEDGAQQSTVTFGATCTTAAVAVWGRADERLYVAWFDSATGLNARSYADDCTDSSGDVAIDAGAASKAPFVWGRASATQAYIYYSGTYDVDGAGSINQWCTERKTLAGGSGSVTGGIYRDDGKVASKPFSTSVDSDDDIYIWLMVNNNSGDSLQKQYVLVRYDTYQPLARAAFRTARAGLVSLQPASVAVISTDKFVWTAAVTFAGQVDIANPETGIDAYYFDCTSRDRLLNAESHGLLNMTGGCPYWYDGVRTAEHGFLLYPAIAQTTAGSGSLTGTYSWRVVYEQFDDNGQRHISALSPVVTDTLSAEDGVITVPYLSLTQRSDVVLKLYRTKASGVVFYEVPGVEEANNPNSSGGIAGTAGGVSFTDDVADASLGKVLYTTGGEVETFAPPSASCVAVHGERTWLGCGSRVYYSHQRVPGEAPTFSENFYVQIPDTVTALASIDSALAIFTAGAVYLLYGEGPDRTGQGAYQNPQRLTTECGCTNPRSVAIIPSGVLFLSTRGLELLPRGGGSVQYIGGPVQSTLASYPDVTAVVVDKANSQVYISCVDDEDSPPTAGVVLVYSYRWNRWTTWTASTFYCDCAGMWSGGYTVARVDGAGVIYQQDSGYADDFGGSDAWIQLDIETGDVRPSGVMKYQRMERVNILGEYRGKHRLYLQVGYDGATAYTDSKYWDDASSSANDPKRWEYSPSRHKAEAIRVRIYDAENEDSPGVTEGVALHALSVSVKPKRKPSKLALAQRG